MTHRRGLGLGRAASHNRYFDKHPELDDLVANS
jgi:hypothetical protein